MIAKLIFGGGGAGNGAGLVSDENPIVDGPR